MADASFFKGVRAYILLAGIGKARCEVFKKKLSKNGGVYCDEFCENTTTHIIVDEKMDSTRLCRLMKLSEPPDHDHCIMVKSIWLSNCLKEKVLLDTKTFELDMIQNKKCNEQFPFSFKTNSTNVTEKVDDIEPSSVDHPSISKVTESESKEKIDHSDNVSGQSTSDEPPKKFRKVGMMYNSYKKAPKDEEDNTDSDYVESGDELAEGEASDASISGAEGENTEIDIPGRKSKVYANSWICAHSSLSQKVNFNKHITDKLEAMARTYESTADRWRALGYTKAVAAVKRYNKEITTFEEAKAIAGVGDKLAEKIWEIIESGELRKLNELTDRDDIKSLNLFTNIWGVGAQTARMWVTQGLRTLDDVRNKANLTRHQKIGMQHYDDFADRMSHDEAGQIEAVVVAAAEALQPGITALACGSYRRGKTTCGDVDVLVTHSDGHSHKGMFQKLLNKLHETGFVTDDLVTQEDNGNQQKWLGVCRLPGDDSRFRRLDIIVIPYDEFGSAMMYFTGSAHFNRSMRHLAGKMGMSLNEHGLFTGVVRKGTEKLTKGVPLPCPTEESVFKHLGLKYRPPEERDH